MGEQVRGEGDAERNRIFAEAYGRDPEFFSFYRSMQAYEAGLRSGDTRMLLKPDSDFFAHVVDEAGVSAEEILYVGDRVDNDVVPARATGLRAIRIRRGAHARIESPEGIVTIGSLSELPGALDRV